jgi:hypothetical protein
MRRPLRRFAYKLALATGRLDVDEVLALPLNKLMEWQAYGLTEPFGEEREDYRMGMICAAILNPQRKKGAPAFTPGDFMPDFGKRFREVNQLALEVQIHRVMSTIARSF